MHRSLFPGVNTWAREKSFSSLLAVANLNPIHRRGAT
jgi:hypothetical protein